MEQKSIHAINKLDEAINNHSFALKGQYIQVGRALLSALSDCGRFKVDKSKFCDGVLDDDINVSLNEGIQLTGEPEFIDDYGFLLPHQPKP
ncbi:MAG: hypothetical protein HGB23_05295 [Chlorobiaceae bacterium]|nr:hypothetical protein [Chlorobiaceae bacterium]